VLIAAKRGSGIEKAAYGGEESMMDGEEVVVCVCVGVWSLEFGVWRMRMRMCLSREWPDGVAGAGAGTQADGTNDRS
jgi:hypothetical protein